MTTARFVPREQKRQMNVKDSVRKHIIYLYIPVLQCFNVNISLSLNPYEYLLLFLGEAAANLNGGSGSLGFALCYVQHTPPFDG